MFHPLAYLVKLNIEMSMAHLIKTIALSSQHNNGDSSLMLTLNSSPDADVFTNDIFAEIPRKRRSLIRGLFGHEEIAIPRKPEEVAVRSHEQRSRELIGDETNRNSANSVSSMEAGNAYVQEVDIFRSSKAGAKNAGHGQRLRTLTPAYGCGRPPEAGS
jgi:hypothetical protein